MTRTLIAALCTAIFFVQPLYVEGHEPLSSKYFTFESKKNERAALFLAKHADSIAESISTQIGFALPERIRVIIARDREQLNNVQPEGARLPDWAVGVAYPHRSLIILLKGSRNNILKTFEHELCHVLLGRAFGAGHRVPRWLHEGMAIIVAREWSMQRLSTMTMAVLTGSLLPMDTITRSFPRDKRRAELAYCQSFYFISFLKNEFGEDEFRTFLNVYSSSKNFKMALWKAYFLHWSEIEILWRSYLKTRFGWVPLLFSTGTLWFLASLALVWGYVHKKRHARKKMQQWETEEMLSGESDGARH